MSRFGGKLEAALDKEADGKDSMQKIESARDKVFKDWLGPMEAPAKKQFRDPAKRG